MTIERGRPSYRLQNLWLALEEGRYRFHRPARDGFTAMGWTENDALRCLRAMSAGWFRKSVPGTHIKGWHDVYRGEWAGEHVYIHFCRTEQGVYLIAALKRDMEPDV